MIVITTDPFMEQQSAIHVKNVEADSSKRKFFSLVANSLHLAMSDIQLILWK
jgi:hypothetical protein